MTESARLKQKVWLFALGSNGEHESVSLDSGVVIWGFDDIPDLSGKTAPEIDSLLPTLPDYATSSVQSIGAISGMAKTMTLRMAQGDIVACPLKTQPGQIALAEVTGNYEYREINGVSQHCRPVKWIDHTVTRKEFGPDAFHYLVTKMTVSQIRKTEVAEKVRRAYAGAPLVDRTPSEDAVESSDAAAAADGPSIEVSARDEIIDRIDSQFPGRKLEHLVAALLQAQGFVVHEADPGADQGVDVLAGHGPLGFDRPRICVQVKHTSSRVSQPEVQQLHGAMQQFDAEQGLFVSWSDYTNEAKRMARLNYFSMRLWNANHLLAAIFEHYEELPEDIRTEIPLKRIWTLVREDSEA